MCLVEADDGFEVFSRTEDARLEVHFFEDEEAAYFYLFGVLAAEAIRSGRLGPNGSARVNGHHNGSGSPRPRPGHRRPQRKTFRSTYEGKSYPTRHLVRLGFI